MIMPIINNVFVLLYNSDFGWFLLVLTTDMGYNASFRVKM